VIAGVRDRGVSSDLQGHAHGISWQATADISLTILEEKLNGGLEIILCFLQ
jgi:hypothetical protein